jgi:hypothetical protein
VTAFQRAYRLAIGPIEVNARTGVDLRSLRIAFAVERDIKRHPNNAEVAVWNLSPSSRQALAKLGNVPVRLEAGYVDDVGVVFQGDLRCCRSMRDGPSSPSFVTRVSGGDGETKIRTARINRTFGAGTPIGTVIGELGKALGVGEGNLRQFGGATLANGSRTLSRALTIRGSVFDELESVTRSCGLQWSVQDSALQLRQAGLPVGDRQGPLLRQDSGLVGEVQVETVTTPETGFPVGSAKVTGTALLRPDLIPGVPFRVESDAFTGNLVCTATVHRGDTHSTDQWVVEWTGRPYK